MLTNKRLLIILWIFISVIVSTCLTICDISLYVKNNSSSKRYFFVYYYVNNRPCIGTIKGLNCGEKDLIFETKIKIGGNKLLKKKKCGEIKKIEGIPFVFIAVTDTLNISQGQCFEQIDSLFQKAKVIKSYTITENDYEYGVYTLNYP